MMLTLKNLIKRLKKTNKKSKSSRRDGVPEVGSRTSLHQLSIDFHTQEVVPKSNMLITTTQPSTIPDSQLPQSVDNIAPIISDLRSNMVTPNMLTNLELTSMLIQSRNIRMPQLDRLVTTVSFAVTSILHVLNVPSLMPGKQSAHLTPSAL